MKPNEIKKDLEHEIHLAEYVDSNYCNSTEVSLIKSALAYINQLEADKMASESTINRLSHKILDYDYQLKQADENLKATMNDVDYYKREYLRLEAEVERLTNKCDDCAGCTQWKCDCANIESEAIKEFAERLIEEKLAVILLKDKNDDFTEGFQSAIDYVEEKCNNLVKEMEGDKQ